MNRNSGNVNRIILLTTLLVFQIAAAEVRLKDIARLEGSGGSSIVGYGLVIGLNGTGDRYRSPYTEQSMANMLDRFGITVNPNQIQPRNVAAVMITADMNPYMRKGSKFDIVASSIGDATSLAGGTLLPTPLSDLSGIVRATGQGSISVGGFNIQAGRVAMRKNYTTVGRIPNGATALAGADSTTLSQGTLRFNLQDPDFTTAQRAAEALNAQFGDSTAIALDAASIVVTPPAEYAGNHRVEFIAVAEALTLDADSPARVVINERTGTIVVGENVRLRPAAVTHGSISIAIRSAPVISQPGPFSQGSTVAVPLDQISIDESRTPVVALPEGTSVGDVAKALNSLGVAPADLIAIFQALKEAGALQAELVVL
ncbi:MAG: flagellar basal body P-ring protein FlgI [bacterium]|nr:flagellar basal body P-ring protein FlgI [bacterium]